MARDAARTAEGTIRFSVELRAAARADRVPRGLSARAEGWCAVLRQLGLLGREPSRYAGHAFGNVSVRDPRSRARFFITATQTADRPCASPEAWTRIDACDFAEFSVVATGAAPPSSETLTHAAIYVADRAVDWIFHIHSPPIWRSARALGMATIPNDVPYGSPALASAVERLAATRTERPLLFATLGHEDGVFSCGADADGAAGALVAALARAQR